MSNSGTYGKKAEAKIKSWLNKPSNGYSFDRIPDQLSGYYMVSRNICDFTCFKYPNMYYIESKSTEHDRFDFSQLSDTQRTGLLQKSMIDGCYGTVVVLFVEYKRAFIINIRDIAEFDDDGRDIFDDNKCTHLKVKSININKLSKWNIPYTEIETIPSRKELLDYTGEFIVP